MKIIGYGCWSIFKKLFNVVHLFCIRKLSSSSQIIRKDSLKPLSTNSFHSCYLYHLSDNFNKQFKYLELKSLLWKAAYTKTEVEFNNILLNISKIDECAIPWLLQYAKPEYWTEVYFQGKRYSHLTSNIIESLNS